MPLLHVHDEGDGDKVDAPATAKVASASADVAATAGDAGASVDVAAAAAAGDVATPAAKTTRSGKILTYVMLHGIVLLYSLAAVCSKMASGQQPWSLAFLAWYAGVLAILVVYAVLWQQVLKRLPLTTAFANKAVTVIWGFLWGMLIFHESIGIPMLIGAALVITGVILVVTSGE